MAIQASLNPKSLHQLLQTDIDTCDQLFTVLATECDSLKQRDHQQLQQLNSLKAPLLIQLEKSSLLRQQWLMAYQQQHPDCGWTDLLEQIGGQFLLDSWEQLNEKFNQCQHQNDINGKMIARSRQSITRLMDILRGLHDAPKLYTSGGSTKVHISQRPFVKA